MNIVTGSGNNRKVFEFPHASVVHNSPKSEQKAALNLLCGMLNISTEEERKSA